jgi:ABC-type multidrug transport system fused ATPase/permease subunit
MQKDVSASGTIKSETFLSRIWRQGRNYTTLVGWLLRRAFTGRHWQLAIAIVLSLLHLGSQAAAIYVVYWYGKQMEKSGLVTVPFLDIHVNLKDDPQWLWAIVAFATASFAFSALLLYLSRKQIMDMAEKYYARSLEQLVLLTLRVPDPRAPVATHLFETHGVGGLAMGSRRGALIAISFANAITAVIGGLGAAVFLFRIDLPLTLVIVVSALVGAIFLYPLTLRAVKSAKDREKAQEVFRAEMLALYDHPNSVHTAKGLESADELSRLYMMRRRVLTELVFATEIGITIALGIVIYYMASQALAGKEQWAVFIAYIGALRMTLVGAALAIRAFASVSRYYPQIVRYYLFMKDMAKVDATQLAEVRRGDMVTLGTLHNGKDVALEAGSWVTLLTRRRMREAICVLVGAKLQRSGEPVASFIVDPTDVIVTSAGLALVSAKRLKPEDKKSENELREILKDKVTIVVAQESAKAGASGETHVLTEDDSELWRFALLGTEEADAALKEFTLKAASKPTRGDMADDEEDEV